MTCNCKICQFGYGEEVAELVAEGSPISLIVSELRELGCDVTPELVRQHLLATNTPLPDQVEIEEMTPISVNLDTDFSEYGFDENDQNSTLDYIQRIALKIFLNQSAITLTEQQMYLDGHRRHVNPEVLRNYVAAFSVVNKCAGIEVINNHMQAIKSLEANGYTVISLPAGDVQN